MVTVSHKFLHYVLWSNLVVISNTYKAVYTVNKVVYRQHHFTTSPRNKGEVESVQILKSSVDARAHKNGRLE